MKIPLSKLAPFAIAAVVWLGAGCSTSAHLRQPSGLSLTSPPLSPLLQKGTPVDWWFVFKFNSEIFPGCGGSATRSCQFGGSVQNYTGFGQQYIYASSDSPTLKDGSGCTGDTTEDPVGATFDEVYNGHYYYVVWNDQFYDDPKINGCTQDCESPWGHSKGMVAWDDSGNGLVMQVSTPSWPGAGSADTPRKTDGNTLGCVKDNDVLVSQHFFSLKINKDDLVAVLNALANSSVVTNPSDRQIVNNGGPADVQKLVASLGAQSRSDTYQKTQLSSGVQLISKPSLLHVPPWQLVSVALDGASIRTANWWTSPAIDSTSATTPIGCWEASLGKPGAVEIATTGSWEGKTFGLKGGFGGNFNHAKIGVTTSGAAHYAIFGDMNQQGTLSGSNCGSSQNGRGGLFFVLNNDELSTGIASLIGGETAPMAGTKAAQEAGTAPASVTPKKKVSHPKHKPSKPAKPAVRKPPKPVVKPAPKNEGEEE